MTFEKWYEENVKYMTTFDFKAWLQEAWDAGLIAEREAIMEIVNTIGGKFAVECAAAIRIRGEK